MDLCSYTIQNLRIDLTIRNVKRQTVVRTNAVVEPTIGNLNSIDSSSGTSLNSRQYVTYGSSDLDSRHPYYQTATTSGAKVIDVDLGGVRTISSLSSPTTSWTVSGNGTTATTLVSEATPDPFPFLSGFPSDSEFTWWYSVPYLLVVQFTVSQPTPQYDPKSQVFMQVSWENHVLPSIES